MIDALILSAGASRRMGTPKALCPLGDSVVIDRILSVLDELGIRTPKVVLAKPHGDEIARWIKKSASPVDLVWNPAPEEGMLSSISCGLRALAPVEGVLLWPVDVPLVQTATIKTLLAADRRRWLVPTFADRGGHPVWLPSEQFADVLALPSSASLRALRDTHPPLRVPVDDPEVLVDVDTPAALETAQSRLRR
ncbi:MAG TPA: nucleotidyltransferase family protein [Pseudomonadota bacterium]|nr:nucleotidyltransferase family protein [Pseudomonadota bacterium]HNO67057.1 nucleotidyltransferase family protein [Pseudomonadota bacterium]